MNTVYPSGMSIDFSGTAGQVAAIPYGNSQALRKRERSHCQYERSSDSGGACAGGAGIVSLHDFRPPSMKEPTTAKYSISSQLVVPADLATIYDLKPAFAAGYTGQGQTIAVVEDSDLYNTADWTAFRKVFGLSSYTSGSLATINPEPPSGSSNCSDPGVQDAEDEATLDAEWSSAAAPDAAIQVATCADTNTTFGVVTALQNLINAKTPPPIISVSYGFCETGTGVAQNAAYNTAYQQAVSEGVSVFVAAGDGGAAPCDRDFPAAIHGIGVASSSSTPYNVAVGGTDFADSSQGTNSTYWGNTNSSTFGSALAYIPEIPWNDSCAGSVLAVSEGFSVGYGDGGYCGSSLAQQSGNITVAAGRGGPSGCATGVTAENLVVGGVARDTPNQPGKRAWPASLTMASGTYPTYRCSPATESGATTTWSAFPIYEWRSTCAGAPDNWPAPRVGLPSPPRYWLGFRRWSIRRWEARRVTRIRFTTNWRPVPWPHRCSIASPRAISP